eukprot:100618-Pelagomonas_calceolata.AAC.4
MVALKSFLNNPCLTQFNQLQADFEYNIQLLEGRDQELQQYDSDASLQAEALADCQRQLAELQEACEEARKGVYVLNVCVCVCERERERERVRKVAAHEDRARL